MDPKDRVLLVGLGYQPDLVLHVGLVSHLDLVDLAFLVGLVDQVDLVLRVFHELLDFQKGQVVLYFPVLLWIRNCHLVLVGLVVQVVRLALELQLGLGYLVNRCIHHVQDSQGIQFDHRSLKVLVVLQDLCHQEIPFDLAVHSFRAIRLHRWGRWDRVHPFGLDDRVVLLVLEHQVDQLLLLLQDNLDVHYRLAYLEDLVVLLVLGHLLVLLGPYHLVVQCFLLVPVLL